MSVQLTLYPQNYNGQYNAVSNVASEKLVDGIFFSSINNSDYYDDTAVSLNNPINNAPPTIVNTWYRWRSTPTGTPTLPTEINGILYLYAVSSNTVSGVYQRLSNLIPGQTYYLSILFDNSATVYGSLTFLARNGTIPLVYAQQNYTLNTMPVGWATFYFTAQTSEDIIQIAYTFGAAQTLKITHASIVPVGTLPTFTNFHLENGQVICDLYQEEDIPLTLSVDNFKNVAEKVQSYSKDFNLPATKRNNLIFDHIFEITRSDDGIIFNPYIKTQCVLKQDGFILFEGYLRLIDVQDQKGEISYNVNLYSEVIALADVLKDRTFSDLDFSELEHSYTWSNIRNSWQGILALENPLPVGTYAGTAGASTTGVLKYPFVDWSHQILLSDGGLGVLGNPELTNMEQAFRPFIRIKYLIEKIFSQDDVPFSWTSTFFDNTFDNLYMDFNWGAGNAPVVFDSSGELTKYYSFDIPTSFTAIPFDDMTLAGGSALSSDFGYSAGVFTAQANGQIYTIHYDMNFEQIFAVDTLEVEWIVNGQSENAQTFTSAGSSGYSGSFDTSVGFPPLEAGDTIFCRAKSTPTGGFDLDGVGSLILSNTPSLITVTTSVNQMTTSTLLGTLRGELGQWEFLKGLMTMFNIVSIPDDDNPLNIIFEPYSDVFISNTKSGSTSDLTLASRSIEHDWTDKVDVSEMKLMPLTDLNKKTIFKFVEDDDDYTFNMYKKSTQNHLYGSKVFDASAFTILDGEEDVEAAPFAATVCKPLFSQFDDFITPAIFTANDEATEFEGFENAPRIMVTNGVEELTSCTYFVPCQNAASPCGNSVEFQFLQFSHLSTIPTVVGTVDYHFGECQLVDPIGAAPTDNLFNTYWLPYYNELYNPNTRIMTMKVNLTPADINTFKFYDRVMIKNRSFRVNKIDYKPNDLATVEFILIP